VKDKGVQLPLLLALEEHPKAERVYSYCKWGRVDLVLVQIKISIGGETAFHKEIWEVGFKDYGV
jgi:hypothetical protein